MFKPAKENEEAFVERLRKKYLSADEVLTEQIIIQEFDKYFDYMITMVEIRSDAAGNVTGCRCQQNGGASYRHAAERVFRAIFQPQGV